MVVKNTKNCKSFNVLFTCIGRRVSLLNAFRDASKDLELNSLMIGTDTTELSPAIQLCDKQFIVKPINHPDYLKETLTIIKKEKVRLLVPTIDTDLQLLAENKAKFEKLDCKVLVSVPDVITICQDKRNTYTFLVKNGFHSPETISAQTALRRKNQIWPCLVKPWDGAAGKEVHVIKNHRELQFYSKTIKNCIVQELIVGQEYTCDCFVDFDMTVRCVVPRKRIEIRGGEVSKGQVVMNQTIINETQKLVEALGAGPGLITVQCFLQNDGEIVFTEINPRFGGGVPLAIKAGANFPKWILSQLIGRKPVIQFDRFKDGLVMLRYDAEVWK